MVAGSLRCSKTHCFLSTLSQEAPVSTIYSVSLTPANNSDSGREAQGLQRMQQALSQLGVAPESTASAFKLAFDEWTLLQSDEDKTIRGGPVVWAFTLPGLVVPSLEYDAQSDSVVVLAGGPSGQFMIRLNSSGSLVSQISIDNGGELMGGTALCSGARRMVSKGGPTQSSHKQQGDETIPASINASGEPLSDSTFVTGLESDTSVDHYFSHWRARSLKTRQAPSQRLLRGSSNRLSNAIPTIDRRPQTYLRGALRPSSVNIAGRSNFSLHIWDVDSGALEQSINVAGSRGSPIPHALLADCAAIEALPRWMGAVSQMNVGPPAVIRYADDGDMTTVYRAETLPDGLFPDAVAAFSLQSNGVLLSYYSQADGKSVVWYSTTTTTSAASPIHSASAAADGGPSVDVVAGWTVLDDYIVGVAVMP